MLAVQECNRYSIGEYKKTQKTKKKDYLQKSLYNNLVNKKVGVIKSYNKVE